MENENFVSVRKSRNRNVKIVFGEKKKCRIEAETSFSPKCAKDEIANKVINKPITPRSTPPCSNIDPNLVPIVRNNMRGRIKGTKNSPRMPNYGNTKSPVANYGPKIENNTNLMSPNTNYGNETPPNNTYNTTLPNVNCNLVNDPMINLNYNLIPPQYNTNNPQSSYNLAKNINLSGNNMQPNYNLPPKQVVHYGNSSVLSPNNISPNNGAIYGSTNIIHNYGNTDMSPPNNIRMANYGNFMNTPNSNYIGQIDVKSQQNIPMNDNFKQREMANLQQGHLSPIIGNMSGNFYKREVAGYQQPNITPIVGNMPGNFHKREVAGYQQSNITPIVGNMPGNYHKREMENLQQGNLNPIIGNMPVNLRQREIENLQQPNPNQPVGNMPGNFHKREIDGSQQSNITPIVGNLPGNYHKREMENLQQGNLNPIVGNFHKREIDGSQQPNLNPIISNIHGNFHKREIGNLQQGNLNPIVGNTSGNFNGKELERTQQSNFNPMAANIPSNLNPIVNSQHHNPNIMVKRNFYTPKTPQNSVSRNELEGYRGNFIPQHSNTPIGGYSSFGYNKNAVNDNYDFNQPQNVNNPNYSSYHTPSHPNRNINLNMSNDPCNNPAYHDFSGSMYRNYNTINTPGNKNVKNISNAVMNTPNLAPMGKNYPATNHPPINPGFNPPANYPAPKMSKSQHPNQNYPISGVANNYQTTPPIYHKTRINYVNNNTNPPNKPVFYNVNGTANNFSYGTNSNFVISPKANINEYSTNGYPPNIMPLSSMKPEQQSLSERRMSPAVRNFGQNIVDSGTSEFKKIKIDEAEISDAKTKFIEDTEKIADGDFEDSQLMPDIF